MRQTLFILFLLVSNTITAQYTSIPDINFEKALISLGIDNGITDGKVLTSSITTLTTLSIGARNISDLTGIEDFINLTELRCQANNLTTLDLSKNLKLGDLRCQTNQLTNLNVTKNLNLKTIWCQENKLTSLDVSSIINLSYLWIDNNYITDIDISKNIGLNILEVKFNLLKSLDVSKNINLTHLQCGGNQLKKIDLSKNLNLYSLYCANNQLVSLDVSKNQKISYLNCNYNNLTKLNLKNGKNTIFNTSFYNYCNFRFNPELNCILVDNSAYSNTNWSDLKDVTASYFDNLDIGPNSTSPQTFCIQQNATLNDIAITGQNIEWYDAQTNGSQLPNTTTIQNGITYYASQTINGCESERVAVLINIQNTLLPTGDNNQPFCTGSDPKINDILVTGQIIKWYDALNNGFLLTETTNLVNGRTYYASQTVNNYESERFGITVSVVNTPSAPTANANQSFCKTENATLNNVQISGQKIKWYDTNFSAASLANNTLLEDNKIYYASQTIGCESDRTPILIRVYDTPLPTANNNQQFCIDENATISNLNITGTALKWYDSATAGNTLTETTLLNNDIYYVTQTLNNCESERIAITVKIQDTPFPIVNSPQIFCIQENAKISDIVIAGQNINWFESISSSINLSESTLLENGITYYVSQTIGSCEGDRIPVSITILSATTTDCINYVDELPFPKFFTPNNDGYNDTWTIDFAYIKPNTGIQIYDRYGKLLKVLLPNSSWNGKLNNQELPATDYWFIVTRANGQEYKGHFSLKR